MRDTLIFTAKIALVIAIIMIPWFIYGDPRCILAECRINR